MVIMTSADLITYFDFEVGKKKWFVLQTNKQVGCLFLFVCFFSPD